MNKGITCSLYEGDFPSFLQYLSKENCIFFAEHCSAIYSKDQLLPCRKECFYMSADELMMLSHSTIWELVLFLFPPNAPSQKRIETYDEFVQSSCLCCLIFYDCGLLDLYVKDEKRLGEFWDKLESLGARDMAISTDMNDHRIVLNC